MVDQKEKGKLNQNTIKSDGISKPETDNSTEEESENECEPDKSKEIWKSDEVCSKIPSKIPEGEKVTCRLKKPVENKSKNIDKEFVPPLRQAGSINVGFTYRAFPTPSRESTYKEEQEVRYCGYIFVCKNI